MVAPLSPIFSLQLQGGDDQPGGNTISPETRRYFQRFVRCVFDGRMPPLVEDLHFKQIVRFAQSRIVLSEEDLNEWMTDVTIRESTLSPNKAGRLSVVINQAVAIINRLYLKDFEAGEIVYTALKELFIPIVMTTLPFAPPKVGSSHPVLASSKKRFVARCENYDDFPVPREWVLEQLNVYDPRPHVAIEPFKLSHDMREFFHNMAKCALEPKLMQKLIRYTGEMRKEVFQKLQSLQKKAFYPPEYHALSRTLVNAEGLMALLSLHVKHVASKDAAVKERWSLERAKEAPTYSKKATDYCSLLAEFSLVFFQHLFSVPSISTPAATRELYLALFREIYLPFAEEHEQEVPYTEELFQQFSLNFTVLPEMCFIMSCIDRLSLPGLSFLRENVLDEGILIDIANERMPDASQVDPLLNTIYESLFHIATLSMDKYGMGILNLHRYIDARLSM